MLITDALCYSTTDICAAGFQDHAVGPIIGANANTGAGDAKVWTHELINEFLRGDRSPIEPLPAASSFRVAVRRTTRVGERSGDPVEDLGVVPDVVHQITRRDLLQGTPDLIAAAGKLLADLPVRTLSAEFSSGDGGAMSVSVTTGNLSRLDVESTAHAGDGRRRGGPDRARAPRRLGSVAHARATGVRR